MDITLNPSGNLTNLGDNAENGLELLLGQFGGSETLKALLASYLLPLNDLQDASLQVHLDRWLDNAEGVQLDTLGAIVREGRNGRTDERYRIAIRSRILVNKSNGTTEELIAIAMLHEPDLETYLFRDYPPHAQVAFLIGPLYDSDPREPALRLQQASAGGTAFDIVTTDTALSASLQFGDVVDPIVSDADIGFGSSVGPTIGGIWANVIPKSY